MFSQAMGIHQHCSYGALLRHSRQVLGFVGILLLGALALSTGARRPYVTKSSSAAHTSKESAMTEAHQEVAPLAQPARISPSPVVLPRVKPSAPIREAGFPKLPGILCFHALRSPPFV